MQGKTGPLVRIGKNGLTDEIVQEINKNIKKHRTIQVKMLRSFIEGKDKKAQAQKIAQKIGARLIDRVGMVLTLYK